MLNFHNGREDTSTRNGAKDTSTRNVKLSEWRGRPSRQPTSAHYSRSFELYSTPHITAQAPPSKGDARHVINERHLGMVYYMSTMSLMNDGDDRGKKDSEWSRERREPRQQIRDSKESEQGSSSFEPSEQSEAQLGNLGFITAFGEQMMRTPNPRKVMVLPIEHYGGTADPIDYVADRWVCKRAAKLRGASSSHHSEGTSSHLVHKTSLWKHLELCCRQDCN